VLKKIRERNTPTGVGKTIVRGKSLSDIEKHPHGRGEDAPWNRGEIKMLETPPRAWGRPIHHYWRTISRRNTPTGVGKTI
ncbi:conserved hypothetical protein, partial [methanotrophic bacterial endosymbiont of Bathymodiolus sp.]